MAQDVATTDNGAAAEYLAHVYDDPYNIYEVSIGTGATLFVDAVGSATATTTTIKSTNATLATASTTLIGSLLYIYSGVGKGEKRMISGYTEDGTTATITFLKALGSSPNTTTNFVVGALAGKDGSWAPGIYGLMPAHHQYVDFTLIPEQDKSPLYIEDIDWVNLLCKVRILNKNAEVHLGDSQPLQFGDALGGDVNVKWDATNLVVLPAADDTGAINIGDGTTDMDVKIFLGTTSDYVLFDVGNVRLDVVGCDLRYDESCLHANVKSQSKTAAYTMAKADNGILTYVATNGTITLPATVVGYYFTLMNNGTDAQYALNIKPGGSDRIFGGGLTPAEGGGIVNTSATAKKGDLIKLHADGASGWFVTDLHGTWANI